MDKMKRTGYKLINKNRKSGKRAKCTSCGGEGIYEVTFMDMYSKLTVILCDDCRKLEYVELKLQTFLNFPYSL